MEIKGWLERRPQVWANYRQGLTDDLAALETNSRLRRAVADAQTGHTGLACFDTWVQELATTGYLHNQARMWFASIWIFTLRLRWVSVLTTLAHIGAAGFVLTRFV